MTWTEILVGAWCLFSPGIAAFWGYKAGYKEHDASEKRRQVIRDKFSSPQENKTDY